MKYNRHQRKLLQFCLLLAVLLLYQIVSLCAAETALNTTIERNSSPSASLLPPPDTTHLYQNICDGDTFVYNGQIYDNTINEIIHLQDINGNDSIIFLHVFKNPSPTVSISANPNRHLCEGESITLTAECDCYTRDTSENFSKLSAYFLINYSQRFGDICPYSDYSPIPGIGSCAGNAPGGENFELSNYPLNVIDIFPIRSNIYPAGNAIKLGKDYMTTPESTIGSITSIPLDLSNPFKITITAKGWGEEPGKIIISVDGIPQQIFNTVHNGWGAGHLTYADTTLYFPAATNSSIITIQTDTIIKANGDITGYRAFINHIDIIRLCHYSWSTGIADTNAVITVQPENDTNYSVTVTSDYGCNALATYNVIVNHPHGTSDTIKACGSYTWHGETYTVSNTYYYTRPLPDANGCYPVDTLHLTINDIPIVHISGNLNITEGQHTTLIATPTGDQPYTYTWSASWSSGTSLSSPDTTNVFNTAVLNETTRYIVTVTDTNGCQGNDTATVNVTLCESWQLVTDASELAVGDRIVITNRTSNYALSTTQNSNNRGRVGISSNNNTITINENVQIITLEQGNINNSYAFNVGNGYLYAASSSSNQLKTRTQNNDNNGSWTINISNNYAASIVAQGNNTNNILQHNSLDPFFSCYNQNSGQEPVKIYKRYAAVSCYIDTIACGMYEWYGHSYENTGVYKHNISNEDGCDTIITLHLTINPIPNAQINTNPATPIICEGNSITLIGSTDCDGTEVILEESFNGLSGNNTTIDGSSTLINISEFPNFSASENVYKAGNAIRIGKSNTNGKITSKDLDLSQPYTVTISAKGWIKTSSSTAIKISATNCSSVYSFNVSGFASGASSSFSNYQHDFNAATASPSRLTIETTGGDKRAFIDSVKITKNAYCTSSFSSQSMGLLYTSINTTSGPISYNVTPQTTDWYYYSVEAPNGCVGKDSVQVVVSKPPELSIIASADTICAGEVDTLWVMRVPAATVGDILCTDNSFVKPVDWADAAAMGKVALGIVFYVDNTGEHGWVVNLQNEEGGYNNTITWGGPDTDIPSLNNFASSREALADMDGYTNTQLIREAGNASTYPAAYAVDFEHGWYLPAAGQLRLLYAELVTLNASLETIGATPFLMNNSWYYSSSTERNQTTVWIVYPFGGITYCNKNDRQYIRSVRNF